MWQHAESDKKNTKRVNYVYEYTNPDAGGTHIWPGRLILFRAIASVYIIHTPTHYDIQ